MHHPDTGITWNKPCVRPAWLAYPSAKVSEDSKVQSGAGPLR